MCGGGGGGHVPAPNEIGPNSQEMRVVVARWVGWWSGWSGVEKGCLWSWEGGRGSRPRLSPAHIHTSFTPLPLNPPLGMTRVRLWPSTSSPTTRWVGVNGLCVEHGGYRYGLTRFWLAPIHAPPHPRMRHSNTRTHTHVPPFPHLPTLPSPTTPQHPPHTPLAGVAGPVGHQPLGRAGAGGGLGGARLRSRRKHIRAGAAQQRLHQRPLRKRRRQVGREGGGGWGLGAGEGGWLGEGG